MPLELRFLVDKHLDRAVFAAELAPAAVMDTTYTARTAYSGPEADDEDRAHVLQLAFERDATVLTADGAMLNKAHNFGPCQSRGHVLGGVIVLPNGKDRQIAAVRAFKEGSLRVAGVAPGDFEHIWDDNLGVDLRQTAPVAIDLCDCQTDEEKLRHYKRYKRK